MLLLLGVNATIINVINYKGDKNMNWVIKLISSTDNTSGEMTEDDITIVYTYKKVLNIDTDGDGEPDVNIDPDKDGKPDINIDTDGDGKADLNLDLDGDGIADANIDTNGDGIADKNIIGAVDTGSTDMFKMIMYSSIAIVAALLLVILMLKNKKKEKEA